MEINEKATRQLFVINSGKFNFDFSWEVHNRTKLKGLRCPEGEKLVSVTPETGTVPCSTRKRCQLAFCPPGRLSLSGCDLLLKVILSVNTTLCDLVFVCKILVTEYLESTNLNQACANTLSCIVATWSFSVLQLSLPLRAG